MIKVYGASDDLICVEGESINDEFYVIDTSENEPVYLAFGDGTFLKCYYNSEAIWKIDVLQKGTSFISKDDCVAEGEKRYSDFVFVGENVKRVLFGRELLRSDDGTS